MKQIIILICLIVVSQVGTNAQVLLDDNFSPEELLIIRGGFTIDENFSIQYYKDSLQNARGEALLGAEFNIEHFNDGINISVKVINTTGKTIYVAETRIKGNFDADSLLFISHAYLENSQPPEESDMRIDLKRLESGESFEIRKSKKNKSLKMIFLHIDVVFDESVVKPDSRKRLDEGYLLLNEFLNEVDAKKFKRFHKVKE